MTQPAKAGDNSAKSYIDRAINIMTEQDTLKEDLKELFEEAKNNGEDVKAMRIAIRQIRTPIEDELKEKVNSYLEVKGQLLLFV